MGVNELRHFYSCADRKQPVARKEKNVTVVGFNISTFGTKWQKSTLALSFDVWDFFSSADIANNHFVARLIHC